MSYFNIQHSLNKSYPLPARRRATPENLASLGASLDRVDWSSVYNTDNIDLSLDNDCSKASFILSLKFNSLFTKILSYKHVYIYIFFLEIYFYMKTQMHYLFL